MPDSQIGMWTLTTVFWTAFLLGRFLAPLALRRCSKEKFILVCLGVAAAGTLLLLTGLPLSLVVLGAALAGLGLAPVFPTAPAQFTERFGVSGRASGEIGSSRPARSAARR